MLRSLNTGHMNQNRNMQETVKHGFICNCIFFIPHGHNIATSCIITEVDCWQISRTTVASFYLVSQCQLIIIPKQVLKPGSAQEPHNLS